MNHGPDSSLIITPLLGKPPIQNIVPADLSLGLPKWVQRGFQPLVVPQSKAQDQSLNE